MKPVTPGWQTSEFWIACGAAVVTAVTALLQYLQGSADQTALITAITGLVASIVMYIYSRIRVKEAHIAAEASVENTNTAVAANMSTQTGPSIPANTQPPPLPMILVLISAFVFAGASSAQEVIPKPEQKVSTTRVLRSTAKGTQHVCYFMDREKMREGKPKDLVFRPQAARTFTLPIDWAKNFDFPMYLNDQLGICYYAAGCHLDNTWTANTTTKSDFNLAVLRQRYLALSGGDNGLYDAQMQKEMRDRYLADVTQAKIIDFMYIDVRDPAAVQAAIHDWGGVMFTMAVPTRWINDSDTGAIWDVPATPNPNFGHAVIFNGVDSRGYYRLQTWGTYVWITPKGVNACDPDGWIAFSTRWFAPSTGYAPNGMHITKMAKMWQDSGGKAIPASVINAFPPPSVDPPIPPPIPPTPGGSTITLSKPLPAGTFEVNPLGTRATYDAKLNEIRRILDGLNQMPGVNGASEPMEKIKLPKADDNKRLDALEKNISTLTDAVLQMQKLLVPAEKKTSKVNQPYLEMAALVETAHYKTVGDFLSATKKLPVHDDLLRIAPRDHSRPLEPHLRQMFANRFREYASIP